MNLLPLFSASHIIDALVVNYGLPHFIFEEKDSTTILIQREKQKTKIQLIPYSQYSSLPSSSEKSYFIFEDQWRKKPNIIASKISWLADYHEKIQARDCIVKKITKTQAEEFHTKHHLMGFANSAYHYGLIHSKQIIAVASFSKGRKMDRLPENKRSFELVRYSAIEHTSITGGLTKLISEFRKECSPGDIMTYVDQLSGDTKGYETIGFIKSGNSAPIELYVNSQTHERFFKNPGDKKIVSFVIPGNTKLILSCLG